MALSSEVRVDDEVLTPLRFGEEAGGSMLEPRHCVACETTFTVVTVAVFVLASFVFWRASLRRFERFVFEFNWAEEPRPEIDIAVDREP